LGSRHGVDADSDHTNVLRISSLAIDLERALPGHRFYPVIVAFNWQLLTRLVSVNVSIAKVAPTS
jgi:hypothetical protein